VIKAVIFDLDDTLYPERDYVRSGFRAVAHWAEANLAIPAASTFSELEGLLDSGVRHNTFDQWLKARGLNQELVPQLVRVYRDHQPAIEAFPEAAPLLSALFTQYRIGLVSDGWLDVQQRKFAALGLAPYFHATVFSDEFGRTAWKPSPKPFAVILDRLQCPAGAEAVYVADNPSKDFLGARRGGLSSVWVCRPGAFYTHFVPETAEHRPDLTIASLSEVPNALEQLNGIRV
jgi:putative hydrolase of the HAD superfamily